MITGVVTDDRQAIIHLIVRGPTGEEQEIKEIVDTGFNGCLSLPSSLVERLGLIWRRLPWIERIGWIGQAGRGRLGDGVARGIGVDAYRIGDARSRRDGYVCQWINIGGA